MSATAHDSTPLMIEAVGLGRTFKRRVRESGLRAALRSFVKPVYVEKAAVNDVSFVVPRGAVVGLVGANGAGKTTLMKMIAGLLHPTAGRLRVMGYDPAARARDFQKRIGMVMGQKSQLWIDIPASETYELLASIYQVPPAVYRARVRELADAFQVTPFLGVQVRKLSLGERMKLEIMAALLHQPDLLILDEPTIGLDVVSRRTIRRFIREYNEQRGTTILLSSHDMTDISEVCEKLLLVSNGRIVFDGPLADFERRARAAGGAGAQRFVSFVFELDQEPSPEALSTLLDATGARLAEREPGWLKFGVDRARLPDLVAGMFKLGTPLDLQFEAEDLESLVHEVMAR